VDDIKFPSDVEDHDDASQKYRMSEVEMKAKISHFKGNATDDDWLISQSHSKFKNFYLNIIYIVKKCYRQLDIFVNQLSFIRL
jgi:hypothetical protein